MYLYWIFHRILILCIMQKTLMYSLEHQYFPVLLQLSDMCSGRCSDRVSDIFLHLYYCLPFKRGHWQ